MIEVIQWMGVIVLGIILSFLLFLVIYITVAATTEWRKNQKFQQVLDGINPEGLRQQNEEDIRESIAKQFDEMASQRDPEDPEGSALQSLWAMGAADRIRHPERYSGVAQGGIDVLH